jgi:hypothetical protein
MIEIVVMDISRTKRVEAQVQERVKAKVCVCGCGRSTEEFVKLGLSRHCYYEYTEQRKQFSKRQSEAYRAKLIREGSLLEPHEIRSIVSTSVFASVAKDIRDSA